MTMMRLRFLLGESRRQLSVDSCIAGNRHWLAELMFDRSYGTNFRFP